jgi:hypothetical protein
MTGVPADLVTWGRKFLKEGEAELYYDRARYSRRYFLLNDLLLFGVAEQKKVRITEMLDLKTANIRDPGSGIINVGGTRVANAWAADNFLIISPTPELKAQLYERVSKTAAAAREKLQRDRAQEGKEVAKLSDIPTFKH